jgi:hypothetical protein
MWNYDGLHSPSPEALLPTAFLCLLFQAHLSNLPSLANVDVFLFHRIRGRLNHSFLFSPAFSLLHFQLCIGMLLLELLAKIAYHLMIGIACELLLVTGEGGMLNGSVLTVR